jgi:CHAD domain-containing protein
MRARVVEGLDPAAPLRPNAARILRTRIDEVRSLAAPALEPGAETAQHDLRIAAKRLRYLLEVVEVCFGEEAAAARRAARELQGVLGEIHDCDVMLPRIRGIGSLAVTLRERRHALYLEFRELWRSEERKGTWAALERALAAA